MLLTSEKGKIKCSPDGRSPGRSYILTLAQFVLQLTVACLRRCPSQISKPKPGFQGFAGEGNVGEARAAARRTRSPIRI
jgi:hypothetical protein